MIRAEPQRRKTVQLSALGPPRPDADDPLDVDKCISTRTGGPGPKGGEGASRFPARRRHTKGAAAAMTSS